jgi:hypothetical protein
LTNGFASIIKLLYIKGNNYQNKETTYRMGENLCCYSSDKVLISGTYNELNKLNTKKANKLINDKGIQQFSKEV